MNSLNDLKIGLAVRVTELRNIAVDSLRSNQRDFLSNRKLGATGVVETWLNQSEGMVEVKHTTGETAPYRFDELQIDELQPGELDEAIVARNTTDEQLQDVYKTFAAAKKQLEEAQNAYNRANTKLNDACQTHRCAVAQVERVLRLLHAENIAIAGNARDEA